MLDSEQLIHTFYKAFQKKDFAQMQNCYAKQAQFEDPAFGKLNSAQTRAMWHMLCKRGLDLVVTYEILSVKENEVHAKWIADYTFQTYKTHVRNEISSRFKLKNNKIIDHKDTFNFWKWSRQALGFTGVYLGWTPLLKRTVKKNALATLASFIEKNPQYRD